MKAWIVGIETTSADKIDELKEKIESLGYVADVAEITLIE